MSNELNIDDYKQKIFNKLEPSGWGRVLKPFISVSYTHLTLPTILRV